LLKTRNVFVVVLHCQLFNYTCQVYPKDTKLPFHWTSAVPFIYKKNIILGDLHRASKISSNFDLEITRIKQKFRKAGYPWNFINNTITKFHQEKPCPLIPDWLFEERTEVYFRVPFCQKNEKIIRNVVSTLESFTNNKVKFIYFWKTRNIKSLFPLKDKLEL